MNEILIRLLWGQLQSIGLFTEKNSTFVDLKTKSGLPVLYHRWLEESIAVLTRHHYLACDQATYTVQDPATIDMEAVWREWDGNKRHWLEDPITKGQVALVEATLRALPDILTSKTPATSIMFPNSSTKMVEGVYKNNPVADYFNGILADILVMYIEERLSQDPAAQIRIIEIGAGTGGTSATVFKKIKPYRDHIKEYCYTDISKAFLLHGENEYGPDNPYLTYRIFDLDAPLAGQDIEAGGYDIAIATNVLHATKNIRRTLRNTKMTLKRNGLLLLNEISGNALFTHLTFGLLEGWWLYEDAELRIPGCPGLFPQTWQAVLEDEGFRSVLFPAQEAHELGQQIIVAESDGIVRQKKQLKPVATPVKKNIKPGADRSPVSRKPPQPSPAQARQPASRKKIPGSVAVTDRMVEDHVRTIIKETIAEALKMEEQQIQDDRSFSEYGVDSIVAVNLVNLINKQCHIPLPTTVLFDYNNVDQLTKHIMREHHTAIISSLQEKAPALETGSEPGGEAIPVPVREKENGGHNGNQSRQRPARNLFPEPEPNPQAVSGSREKDTAWETVNSDIRAPFRKEPIAIIGMSGRFAGSDTVNELWEHLAKGDDLIEEVSRWDLAEHYPEGTRYCKHGSFLDGIDRFDPRFFNISGLEATFMDPQQRLFLEESWKALEDAGYAGAGVQGRLCGVYVGCSGADYPKLFDSNPPPQAFWGNAGSVIPARIAYHLDLQGPAITVDTACSSSLVAVHLACQGLWAGETELALAGGVFVQATPEFYLTSNRAGMLSLTGRCHTFGEQADGFVPGEGVGVIVLKRLQEAIADGDHIYGVIRGTGLNQDGTTNGITAPSANSQERLERYVYDTFSIHPGQIQMAEAHGTGTKLGDPIEYQALTRSFRAYTDKQEYCAIGSIKSNLGHAAAAAGIAGLIKVLLSLQHKQIPPSLHFQSGNPHIQFKDSPFYVNTSLKDWDVAPGSPRCAVTSSFGFSGTNAHIAIEEAPPTERRHAEKPGYLIVLSARASEQLRQQAGQLLAYCEGEPLADCGSMSFTLLLGRKHFNHRLACVVRSREELIGLLKKWLAKGKVSQIYVSELRENDQREQPALKRYGNECIENCHNAGNAGEYLEHLSTVADLYVQGYELDFGELFTNEQYARISLPTYPFARESYWIAAAGAVAAATAGDKARKRGKPDTDLGDEYGRVCAGMRGLQMQENAEDAPVSPSQEPFEMMTFEESWEEQTLPAPAPAEIKTVVCFLSNPAYQQRVIDAVQALGQQTRIIFISQSAGYQKHSRQMYSISPIDRDTYQNAFRSIREEYGNVDAILYLWALEDKGHIQDAACIVRILQAITAVKLNPGRLLLAAQYQSALERCYLESWIGFERSLGLVLPHTQVALICRGASEGRQEIDIDVEDWLRLLWGELQTGKAQSVLYQDGQRHVCRIRPTSLQAGQRVWRAEGTYLITGGCGGLGFLIAQHIAKMQPVQLILTGRSAIDDEKQAKIKALEDLGSRVLYIQADVCDETRMKEKLNRAKEHFGSIHGVIHAAGTESNQTIFEKEIPSFTEVLAPKIKGALVLDDLLPEEPLDFICYFSSSAAILGDFGSCDYAIGNRFLMAYAHYRNQRQRPGKAVVINWPLWKDGGMGHQDDENAKMYLKSSGQRFLEAEEGMAVLDRILSQGSAQSLVLVGQRSRVNRFLDLVKDQPAPLGSAVSGSPGKGRRAEIKGLSLEECLEWDLKENISNLLKISRDKLDAEANLADFGFDSLSLAEFATLLTNHYGIEITPALFFQYSTLAKLTQYFLTGHQAAIREFYREEEAAGPVGPQKEAAAAVTAVAARLEPGQPRFEIINSPPSAGGVPEPIAIIGMSGRFPDARNIDEMWAILAQGQEAVREVPADRFTGRGSKWRCGLLPGMREFDPLFFEISPLEAEIMDPRQRLLLQESWKALEDAGYGAARIKTSKIGMFVGVEDGQYGQLAPEKANITSNHNAILAARLAYFLNLSGPNMAINTACSSGLVAAHQACWSLRNQECDTALAAGVNLLLLADMFEVLTQAGMLSADCRCYAFDKRANGLVPGEAVAAVVLKRLSQAQADGDQIYAVIKGSGINYDGKTNGITAPSGSSQTGLLKAVYEQYRLNPEEIEYIVTHGTGTKLGDPVEINALYDAFKDYTRKQSYCALTSTKTNFGHTFAASGLVSLISLVQALRHETIPASLHCEQENDYINWQESPFYVNKAGKPWPQAGAKDRTGAVSAFGMSGTNAHMVVQSYTPEQAGSQPEQVPFFLLALSAKTREALQEKIRDMIAILQNKDWQGKDLLPVSYTLLAGRQHFNHRCAIVIQDREDAVYVWQQAGGEERLPNLFQGKVPRDFKGQKAMQEYGEELLQRSWALKENRNKYQETLYVLADLYCQGYDLPWDGMFGDAKPRCVGLPTYPFAREHYWVSPSGAQPGNSSAAAAVTAAALHPLLHQNTSDLSEQRFSSTFTGQEFFLADHVVKGQPVLPGVAYLEMARAAVAQATGSFQAGQSGIRLENVVWVRPLAVGEQPVQVHIGLFPEDNGKIAFEIYTEAAGAGPVVHSQGSAVLSPVEKIPPADLPALQAQCSQSTFSASQCYQAFQAMGLQYGPGHQGIEMLYAGADQVLAKLSLPAAVADTLEHFVLHPGLLDSALQTSIGFLLGAGDPKGKAALKPFLPFALTALEIHAGCTAAMWALIRRSDGGKAGDKVQKLDIDLYDAQGNVCVRIKGFSSRGLEGEVGPAGKAATPGTLMLYPGWKEQAVAQEAAAPAYVQQVVMLCEPNNISRETIESRMSGVRCLTLASEQDGIEKFPDYAAQVFEEIQSILKSKPAGKVLLQIVVPNREEQQLFTGLAGFLKTARWENPQIIGQLIEVEPDEDPAGIIEKLQADSRSIINSQVRYQDGKRYVAALSEMEASPAAGRIPWKDQGVYLITGGAGGLGLLFAREIAQKVKDTTLILTGRSPLTADRQAKLKQAEAQGARIVYRQVDVTREKAVADLIQSIQTDFGGLNGIIHSAGVIKDNFIIKKTKAEVLEVLAPKVTGLVHLDQASQHQPLDFFILFSSGTGVFGNAGQADYAAANAFMDAYARYRNTLVASQQRRGQTLSVNWPLWQEGGMRVDAETEKMLRQTTGMVAMGTATGIRALYQGLASGQDQVLVMEGELKRLRAAFLGEQTGTAAINAPNAPHTREENKAVPAIDQNSFQEKAVNYFKRLLSTAIKLPAHRIEAAAPMEQYGIDSMMVMQLTNQLEKIFGLLPKTLFFEYQNIKDLTGYFLENYRGQLTELVGIEDIAAAPAGNYQNLTAVTGTEAEELTAGSRRRLRFASLRPEKREETAALDIAVIGVAGRYPQADNIRQFWQNLRDGKDCITEIPKERWDHSLYFDADKNKPGKAYSKWGGFINGVDQFDPLFFNISPREAQIMDPQERLFLQCVYETLEDAGYTRETLGLRQDFGLGGNVGVYVGVMYEEYQLYGAQEQIQGRPVAASGNPSSIANRVSYFCNFHGPSLAVDTMCSSSLTAIHLACQSLQRGNCEAAIAGGVNVSIHPNKYLMLSQGKFASSKGRCESFGQGGDGYVPGEGVGAVLLKPLAKAVADGDHIYGIIKGTALNHGGKTNGYTVPNPNAQASVIGRAFQEAGIDPRTISYIEAHGTGTSLGDPIEITGLTKTFQAYTQDKQFCAIGSAKSNIGHCESAAGIAGVTKILLQLKYQQLAPSLHSQTLNPNIDFSNTPFVVQQELAEWKRPVVEKGGESKEYPRIAGISSFGAGGANAHIVIEEYIARDPARPPIAVNAGNPAIIVLSAKNEERLREQVRQLLAAIEERQFTDNDLADVAYTLQAGREAMEERLAVLAGSVRELVKKLKSYADGRDGGGEVYRGQVKRNKETLDVFAADEDMAKTVAAWITKGKYAKLIDLWVKGLIVDWNRLYGDVKPRRISMPTYPFAKERYWLFDATLPAKSEDRPQQRAVRYLQKQWEPCSAASAPISDRTVAILTTQETMELAIQLAGHFLKSEIIDIDTYNSHELESQLQQPETHWKNYGGCVDLIGCGQGKSPISHWITWLQRLTEYGQREGLMLLGVTKGLESYQNTVVNLAGAARAGLYRMLQSEYGHLRSRHMDADPSTGDQALARQIASEFCLESEDPEICYRDGKRYRAYLDEFEKSDDGNNSNSSNNSQQTLVFPEGHVLWITGGTRGIGYQCARHFVTKHGVRRLVLTGRETMPPRAEWDAYQSQNTAVAQKIQAIRALEAQGAQVQVLSVSLTDEQAVQESLEEIKGTMGPIGGIIHCAGVGDAKNPAFIRKSVGGMQQVLDPKVDGLNILYQSFSNEPLQFFVLFSSVSAIIPALAAGQSDYAMANAYMDYFADARADACPIVSIVWPSWKETGMGEVKTKAYQQTGLLSHTNEEGLQLLDQILSGQLGPVVLPAVVNPDLWQPRQLMQRKKQETLTANIQTRRPAAAKTPPAPASLLTVTQKWLVGLFAQELRIDSAKLEMDTAFQDYGMDSILLAQVLGSINQLLANDLDPSILFEYSTIESLATWLVNNHASSLGKILDTGSPEQYMPPTQASSLPAPPIPSESPASRGLQTESHTHIYRSSKPQDIAVIGLACRFPGANSLEEYWQLLAEGRSAIRSVPEERWGYLNNFSAGLVDNITQFDAKLFMMPEKDVRAMDPQALVILEESLKLWYHAGYSPAEIKGKQVGVYLGGRSLHRPDEASLRQAINPIVAVGQNYLAANISQYFDLRGPSIVVDTACSSALVGMNMAMQALNNGDIEAAVVGGVSLLNTDASHQLFHQRGILSPDPVFHVFDQRSRGIVLGEGAGLVLLKTVEQALADGDRIYAVIKALAINNDGRTAGPATPNLQAQKEVLQTALARSGKQPEAVIYIEANGSGSEVTDLLELKAIQSVYRLDNTSPLMLGSVKPNIGHPLCAEGIASFIKVALMLQYRQFVPFLSGEQPMTHYNIESSPFYFSRKLTEWKNTPRIAAINCFADGGTNAHVILEAWEEPASRIIKRHPNPPPAINRQQFGPESRTGDAALKVIWEMFK
ncbi:SDR family NAD(P)-dependent oxidoreductase [Methylomusa anaerophila]|nr:SDR family NAD(P)-dependent oxidoreductase [Methylomusa anaerophila]